MQQRLKGFPDLDGQQGDGGGQTAGPPLDFEYLMEQMKELFMSHGDGRSSVRTDRVQQADALASIPLRNDRGCQSGVVVGEVPAGARTSEMDCVPGAPRSRCPGPWSSVFRCVCRHLNSPAVCLARSQWPLECGFIKTKNKQGGPAAAQCLLSTPSRPPLCRPHFRYLCQRASRTNKAL